MTIIPTDDARYEPRIAPKVFSDVPSSAELKSVRWQRTILFLGCVLLSGALIAIVATDADADGTAQERDKAYAERDRAIADRNELSQNLRRLQLEYGAIERGHSDVQKLRRQIASLLENQPDRERAGLIRGTFYGRTQSQISAWPTRRAQAISDLRDELNRLRADEEEIRERIQQGSPAPTPPPATPEPSAPPAAPEQLAPPPEPPAQ